jgi:formylglycine-generating enzyme required for sulfatase activity
MPMMAEDVKSILSAMDRYHQLKVPIPPPLLFVEAKAAKANDPVRAFSALQEFLKNTPRDGRAYSEALAIFPEYERAAQAEQAKLADEQRVAKEAKEHERQVEAATQKDAALQRLPQIVAEIQDSMHTIPAGSFRMGDPSGKGYPQELPVHPVHLKAFKVAAFDVTFDQYDVFALVTGRSLPGDEKWGRGRRPVINVTWNDAKAFIAWLSQQAGTNYRLPTEAEWEYAARAGTSTAYYWGNSFDESHVAKYWGDAVGSRAPNAFGLYDMLGNVEQWTQDCRHPVYPESESYAGAPSDGSEWGGGDCSRRMRRGGAWGQNPTFLRVSYRESWEPTYRSAFLGFRLAQDR